MKTYSVNSQPELLQTISLLADQLRKAFDAKTRQHKLADKIPTIKENFNKYLAKLNLKEDADTDAMFDLVMTLVVNNKLLKTEK